MNKMIARTALVATIAVSAMSLSACGTNTNDCAHAAGANTTITANTAMFPSRAGGGHAGHGENGHGENGHGESGHSESGHDNSNGGFILPHLFSNPNSECQKPATSHT